MTTRLSVPEVAFPANGLVPAIVQDQRDGRVLMLAWVDAEALEATIETGDAHFHSRSRDRLWRKGESSGNTLRVIDLAIDCDGDALLLTVDPNGPTCHRGTRSCFDLETRPAAVAPPPAVPPSAAGWSSATDPSPPDLAWLETLWATIADRAATRPAGSYTSSLLDGGVDVVGRKVAEEATEVLIAAKDDAAAESTGADRSATTLALAGEAADLLYHLLVLLAERGQRPADVIERLQRRHGR